MVQQENDNWKPAPTRLVLLDQVQAQKAGSKIRFLGCVHEYQCERGILVLKEQFPNKYMDAPAVAVMPLDEVRNGLGPELVQVGAWLNIIGVVKASPPPAREVRRKPPSTKHAQTKSMPKAVVPAVEASIIWSAGAIKLDRYQAAAEDYQESIRKSG